MGVFITTTDSLVPHVSSKADQVPEKELSRYINDIMKAQRKLNEDNDMSMVDDRNVSKNFQATIIKLLKRALKAAKDYNPTAQYTILQMVTSVISNEEQQTQDLCMFHISKYPSFFKEAGWDLLEWVEPFMYTATGDEPMNGEVRRYATKLFRQVAQQVSYNEVLMLGAEQMSLMDWDDVLSDEEKSVRATIKMVEYFGIFGEAIERITVPQMILDRIVYPTQYISKTVHFLERIIRERSSWGDRERSTSRWDQVVFVMTNSLLDFVEYGKNTTMVNNKHPLFNSKKQQVKL
ncbi:hypothetical protein BDA99DRAFT_133265 [Phascolomyces articulosus]|uniref:Uncharacterized protein n=1 Tax=Phascolomyces articulosus TaxID=60185 RepID=A0AAD5JWE1_9FUNG|nr:hypothetical protein BDA99DRAFT_133265 [Phascolomyces articulosus]